MVDMGMGEHHIIDLRRIEAKLLIKLVSIDSLKQPAIEQNLRAAGRCNQVFTARYGPGRAEKLNGHDLGMFCVNLYLSL